MLKKIRRVKFDPESNRRLEFLSIEDPQELIGACAEHLRPIVVAALNTGMRKEEVLSLQWEKNMLICLGCSMIQKPASDMVT